MYLNRLKMCLKFKNCIKMLAFNPTFSFENYAKYLNFRLHSLSAIRLWDKNTLGWHFVLSPPQVCEMSVNVNVNVNVYANTLSQAHTKNGRTIKQINQVATCHSLVLSISKLITSFNEDKRFVCSCLSVLPVRRLSAAHYVHGSTFIYICIYMYICMYVCTKIPQHVRCLFFASHSILFLILIALLQFCSAITNEALSSEDFHYDHLCMLLC